MRKNKRKKYTKEQLIFYLQKLSNELKQNPRITDMNKKKKYPSASTYVSRFGSWNKSLKLANLKINLRKKFLKKELIDSLKSLSNELGRVPKTNDLKKKKYIASSSTYRKYFGSWNNALKSAGLLKQQYKKLSGFK
jgi:hypothetical protein